MKAALFLAAGLALAACAPSETTRRADPGLSLPPMKTFAPSPASRPQLPNTDLARDFLELTFVLENGTEMDRFTRFEGTVTVGVSGESGAVPPSLDGDLDRLLARLRSEAGIDIRRARPGEIPSIVIEPVKRSSIQRVAPSAACFVRPNVAGWDDYKRRRNDPTTYWNTLRARERMAIFLPNDVSPQEVRDCLHEEIAQALGPVNDVYRLSQSIFNDDNFHTVLTGYDMMILRAYYDPALRNGMSEGEVARRLPAVLSRVNPGGGPVGAVKRGGLSEDWDRAIDTATTPRSPRAKRLRAANDAVALARGFGQSDTRLAFSHYVLGRLLLSESPDKALAAFIAAGRIYQRRPDTSVQEAHVAMQMAAFQLSLGRADTAIGLVDQSLPVVRRSEHAALLSLLLMVKAEALMLKGDTADGERLKTEALGWARYGFGSASEIAARTAEIEAISPRTRKGDPA